MNPSIMRDMPLEMRQNILLNAATMRQELLQRAFASRLDINRDIDAECGYAKVIKVSDYKTMYDREGLATRVVQLEPDESWKADPEVYEDEENEEDTEFEAAWNDIVERFNIWEMLKRIDRLSGVGHYGVLLIGCNDGKTLRDPVASVLAASKRSVGLEPDAGEGAEEEAGETKRELLFLRAFDESEVTIAEYEKDPMNPRFGLPSLYNINFISVLSSSGSAAQPPPDNQMTVHWTRILHVADNRESSEVFGVPRLRRVWNRNYDLRKVLASSGEGFWKGAFPGLSFETAPDVQTTGEVDTDSIKEQMENYANSLSRYIATVGMTVKSLSPQVTDPTPHFLTHLKAIATTIGCPWRIFIGSEEAKLASTEDGKTWGERIKGRQNKYLTPMLIRPFAQRLIDMGILPPLKKVTPEAGKGEKTGTIKVSWPEMTQPTDNDKATVAKLVMEAMSSYISAGGDALIAPLDFLTRVLKFSKDEAEAIMKAVEEYQIENAPDEDEDVDPITGEPIVDKDEVTEGTPGSRFGKKRTTKTPKEKEPDPKDKKLERDQKQADIERTRAEAKAKARPPGKR